MRNIGAIGCGGQKKLLMAKAVIAGCGGLGGWITEILARCGVGRILVIDCDTFCESNLNRQLYSEEANIGSSKALAAYERIKKINSSVEAEYSTVKITESNAESLISGADVVMDGLDSNASRRIIFNACLKLGIPFIHGAIGGFYGEAALLTRETDLFSSDDAQESSNLPFVASLVASAEAALAVKYLTGVGKCDENRLIWFDADENKSMKLNIK